MSAKATVERQIVLEFAPSTETSGKKRRFFRDSLSAVELADDGGTLFVGVDESLNSTPTIERLSWADGGYAAHEPLDIQDFLQLEDTKVKKGRVPEVDIEGLSVCDSFLWVVGSHSSARKKPKHRTVEEDIERLARVEFNENRALIGRICWKTGPSSPISLIIFHVFWPRFRNLKTDRARRSVTSHSLNSPFKTSV